MPASKSAASVHEHPTESSAGDDADEREYADFAGAQDPLDIEATTWAVLRSDGLDTAGEKQLQEWLAADPTHAQALADMEATLGDVQQLPEDEVASLRSSLGDGPCATPRPHAPAAVPLRGSPPRAPNPGWKQWLPQLGRQFFPHATAAALAAVAIGGGWLAWEHWTLQPTFAQSYATSPGQSLTVQLPDGKGDAKDAGSEVQLDTSTQVQARLYRDHRDIRLESGQALFAVHADAERPFHVWAGGVRITVVGTRFSVRHTTSGLDAEQTVIAVEEGRVRIAPSAQGPDLGTGAEARNPHARATVELSAGQMVVADKAGQLGPVSALPAHGFAPWKEGRLDFAQTPLSQAIAEFERYGPTGIVVRDPAVAALPVGGSYGLTQARRFAESLPLVLPVRLVRKGSVTEIVAR